MSATQSGGPAFPGLNAEMTGIDSNGNERWETEPSGGMSLRDYFAAQVIATLINNPESTYDQDATNAYRMADAMLEARK
jgi:hypothetical protein